MIHSQNILEEIRFYERKNKRLAVEDLLREIAGKKKIYEIEIRENEERMERIWRDNICT